MIGRGRANVRLKFGFQGQPTIWLAICEAIDPEMNVLVSEDAAPSKCTSGWAAKSS